MKPAAQAQMEQRIEAPVGSGAAQRQSPATRRSHFGFDSAHRPPLPQDLQAFWRLSRQWRAKVVSTAERQRIADAARLARRVEACDDAVQARDDVLSLVLLSRPCEALRLRDQAVLAMYGQASQVASQPAEPGSHACRGLMSEMLQVWQRALVEVEPLREAAAAMRRSHDETFAAVRRSGRGALPSTQPWQHAWEAQMDAHERIVDRLEALIDERLEEEVDAVAG